MICPPLNKVANIILEHIERQPTEEIKWSHKATPKIGQDDNNKAWVAVETPIGEEKFEAIYISGRDGANSQICRSLFW